MMHPSQLENQMNNQCELDHQFYPVIPIGQPGTKNKRERKSHCITSKYDASWCAHTHHQTKNIKGIHFLLVSY